MIDMLKRMARDIFRGILREVIRDMYRRQKGMIDDEEKEKTDSGLA